MTAVWGAFAGGVTLAASQTGSSGTDLGAVLVALIAGLSAVGAAWVASRSRNRGGGQDTLGDDEVIIKRDEYDRLRRLERRRRPR